MSRDQFGYDASDYDAPDADDLRDEIADRDGVPTLTEAGRDNEPSTTWATTRRPTRGPLPF